MTLTYGVNTGFCATSPTADPAGTSLALGGQGLAVKDTSPSTAGKVTEIGFWTNTSSSVNFEVGIYADDSDKPGTLLHVSRTNAMSGSTGWQKVTVDFDIEPSTVYWIAIQVDSSSVTRDYQTSGGQASYDGSITTLPDPWVQSSTSTSRQSVYAVWETGAYIPTMKVNIGDVWKDVVSVKINIGDTWKDVTSIKQNIGDTWKDV